MLICKVAKVTEMFSLIDNTIGPVINEASAVYVAPRWKTAPPPQLQLPCSSQKPLSGMINSNHQSFPAPSAMSSLRHQYDCEAPTSRTEELRVREPIRSLDHIFSQTITDFLKTELTLQSSSKRMCLQFN